ncbi:MAG: primase alpha helix C-terminal domain-containing protein [Tepidisphaerales bacterium]
MAPEWLLERIGKQPAAADPACEDGLIPEGRRNATLTSLAGKLRRDGLSAAAMEAALLATDQERCSPPLADEEVVRIAERVSRYAAGTLGREDALATPGSTPHSARQ